MWGKEHFSLLLERAMSSTDTAANVRVEDLCFHLLIVCSCFNSAKIKFSLDVWVSFKSIMITYFVALRNILDNLIGFEFLDILIEENWQK